MASFERSPNEVCVVNAASTWRIVVRPEVTFASLSSIADELGLSRIDLSTAAPPLVAGEPELANWSAGEGSTQLSYSFNPVVNLRVLVIAGPDAADWRDRLASRVPRLELADIRELLGAADLREVLLGLYSTSELKLIELLPQVEKLRVHANQRVSATAGRTAEELGAALLELGAHRLAQDEQRRPGHSALFARIADVDGRRAALLAFLEDGAQPKAQLAKVMRSGLTDTDWRVRTTAMLVAARLKATEVWEDIRHMQLPPYGPDGLDRRHHSLLAATQKAILAELAGEPRDLVKGSFTLMPHLRAVIAGEDDGIQDEAREWIESWFVR